MREGFCKRLLTLGQNLSQSSNIFVALLSVRYDYTPEENFHRLVWVDIDDAGCWSGACVKVDLLTETYLLI